MAKCTSCKYCTEIGSDSEGNAVKRRCKHPFKEFEDYVVDECAYYVYESPYSSSSTSSSTSSTNTSYSSATSTEKSSSKSTVIGVIIGIIITICVIVFIGVIVFDNFVSSTNNSNSQNVAANDATLTDGDNISADNTDFSVVPALGRATVTPTVGLNLRTGPSTSYRRILLMEYQKTVTVYYITNGWAFVDFEGTKGWCSCEWLDMSNLQTFYPQTSMNKVLYIKNNGGINLKIATDNNSANILLIADASKITLLLINGDWAYIDYEGYRGWCLYAHLTETVPSYSPEEYLNEDATIKAGGGLFLRSSPDSDASKITLMDNGATIIILIIDSDWAYVDYNGTKGWCSLKHLIRGETDTQESIEQAKNDTNSRIEAFRGKTIKNGRTTMTKDEVLDYYFEVDKFYNRFVYSFSGFFNNVDYHDKIVVKDEMGYEIPFFKVHDSRYTTVEDVCEEFFMYLGDDCAINCLKDRFIEYNGHIYTIEGGAGDSGLFTKYTYEVSETTEGFILDIVAQLCYDKELTDIAQTDIYKLHLMKEDGIWVFTDFVSVVR